MVRIKKKLIAFSVVATLMLLSFFSAGFSVAATDVDRGKELSKSEDFPVSNASPITWGALIPRPSTYSAVELSDGDYQTQARIYSWNMGLQHDDGVLKANYPGEEVDWAYPYLLTDQEGASTDSETIIRSRTSNDYIDPWDIRWLRINSNGSIAESTTVSGNIEVSLKRDWFCMDENERLCVDAQPEIPIQIDVDITKSGPKLLRYDLLSEVTMTPHNMWITDPNGHQVKTYQGTTILQDENNEGYNPVMTYLGFVACEEGVYRINIEPEANLGAMNSATLCMEFFDVDESKIKEGLTIEGSGDENPTWQDSLDNKFKSRWFSFKADKCDWYAVEIHEIYTGSNIADPDVNIFIPCCDQYQILDGTLNFMAWGAPAINERNYIYVPEDGTVYIAIDEQDYFGLGRYSINLEKIPMEEVDIGDDEEFKVEGSDDLVVEWEVKDDSFVRLAWASYGDGAPGWGGPDGTIIFQDAKKLWCFEEMDDLDTKTTSDCYGKTWSNYYHWMPEGSYSMLFFNTQPEFNGIVRWTSEELTIGETDIPITNLGHEDLGYGWQVEPSTNIVMGFESSDAKFPDLKKGAAIPITLTNDIGQYHLNLSINATTDLSLTEKWDPTKVIGFNATDGSWQDWDDYSAQALTSDTVAPIEDVDPFNAWRVGVTTDMLYIAASEKMHNISFQLSTLGIGGDIDVQVWCGAVDGWEDLDTTADTTNELTASGHMILDIGADDDFIDWQRGNDFADTNPYRDDCTNYWLRLNPNTAYTTTPTIERIWLGNQTIVGDFNLKLINPDSPYDYCDFWSLDNQPDEFDDVIICENTPNNNAWTGETWIADGGSATHRIIGIEPGDYYLLVIPEHWSTTASVSLRLALENYATWNYQGSSLTAGAPLMDNLNDQFYPGKDWNYWLLRQEGKLRLPTFSYNWTNYPYQATYLVNTTKYSNEWTPLSDLNGGWDSFLTISCSGTEYAWTNLFLASNATSTAVYILQDLDWIDNDGPNNEIRQLSAYQASVGANGANQTFQFGAISDEFTLLVLYNHNEDDLLEFKVDLRQFDTIELKAPDPEKYKCKAKKAAEEEAPLIPGFALPILIGCILSVSAILIRKRIKDVRMK
jgi:hypothetical protein